MLRFAEEILLLLHNEERGDFAPGLTPQSLNIALAGAVLMDLALEDRIDTDLEHLFLVDATPLDDDLLDPTLADIARDTDTRDTSYWVTQTAKRGEEIRDKALARLINRGILEFEPEGIFILSRLVSRSRRYPTIDGQPVEEVQLRIMRVLFTDEIPDPRDIVIICLADACDVFKNILSPSELSEVQDRIELIRKMDLIGQSVTEAIQKLDKEPPTAPRRFKEIPQAPGLPLIGNAIDMVGDIGTFIATQYSNLGSIFRVRALNRRFIVLVGPEANSFVARGNKHFSNYEPWQHFQADIGASRMLISMEGKDHIRMRRVHAHYYSRNLLENRIADAIDILRREIAEWSQHKAIRGQYAFQRIVTEQMGVLIANTSSKEYLDDIIIFFEKLMAQSIAPHVYKLATYRPRVQRARKRVSELARKILAEHDPKNRRSGAPDFIDELLELNRTDPQYLPETNLPMTALGPVLVGLDTVSSICAFMLYEVLKRPDLLEQMTAEADALFDSGLPTLQRFAPTRCHPPHCDGNTAPLSPRCSDSAQGRQLFRVRRLYHPGRRGCPFGDSRAAPPSGLFSQSDAFRYRTLHCGPRRASPARGLRALRRGGAQMPRKQSCRGADCAQHGIRRARNRISIGAAQLPIEDQTSSRRPARPVLQVPPSA